MMSLRSELAAAVRECPFDPATIVYVVFVRDSNGHMVEHSRYADYFDACDVCYAMKPQWTRLACQSIHA